MKRRVLCTVLAALALLPLTAIANEEPSLGYDEIVRVVEEMAELLDRAIYLAVAGMSPYGRADTTLTEYGQGIVNLIQGPGSRNYDPTSEFTVDEGSGIQPLLFTLEREAAFVAEFLPDPVERSFAYALQTIARFVGMAGEVAEQTAARPPVTYGDPDDMRTIYGYLLAARGGPEEIFLIGGVQTLVEQFPSRIVWVREGESVQDAIERVPEGGTIYLEPGNYRGPLDIAKSVTIAAYSNGGSPAFGAVRIQGHPWNVAVDVESETPISVVLRNLEIYDGAAGILTGGSVSLQLENVVVRDNLQGISVLEGAVVTAVNSQFLGSKSGALLLSGDGECSLQSCRIAEAAGNGVILHGDARLTAIDCSIVDGEQNGFSILDNATLHLEGTTIAGHDGYGLVAYSETCIPQGWAAVAASYFSGTITGWGNTIPGPDEDNGNRGGAICPAEYEFLLDDAPPDEDAAE